MADDGTDRRTFLRTVPLTVLTVTEAGHSGRAGGTQSTATVADSTGAQTDSRPGRWSYEQVRKFVPEDGGESERLGGAVAVSGDGTTAVVGARRDDPRGDRSGSVSVLRAETADGSWARTAKLTPSGGQPEDYFGTAVAVSDDGDTVLGGAPRADQPGGLNAGSVSVFEYTAREWRQRATLTAADGDTADLFGEAVALASDGTTALVGAASDDDPNGPASGSVYLFEATADGWAQSAKLTAPDGGNSDLFGKAVAISGDGRKAIVGADGAPESTCDDGECLRGGAHVFESVGGDWRHTTKLTAPDGESSDTFGESVSIADDGTTALVGADGADSVFLFEMRGGEWTRQTTIREGDEDETDRFGWSVALSGDGTTAFVGAKWDDEFNGSYAGATSVYRRVAGEWDHQTTLASDDGQPGDYFGWAVATTRQGRTALVGARNDRNENGDDAGSAYVFETRPDAAVTTDLDTPLTGVIVSLDATDSASPNGDIAEYQWDLTGDGEPDKTTTDPRVTFRYYEPGRREVTLTVTDAENKTATATTTLFVQERDGPPPLPGRDAQPRDIDGDGLCEDVDGDGTFSLRDVQLYYQAIYANRDSRYVEHNREHFDVTGDGRITLEDVQVLFERHGGPG